MKANEGCASAKTLLRNSPRLFLASSEKHNHLMRALAVVLAALTTGTALKLTNGGMLTRRNFAALGATPLALVLPAHASYLMNQAAQNEQSWKATPKSQERAGVYAFAIPVVHASFHIIDRASIPSPLLHSVRQN